jgi:hypothetical protein
MRGDFRDWPVVTQWADGIAADLAAEHSGDHSGAHRD